MTILMTEMRRALTRRAVQVLISLGLLGCAIAGVVSYFGSRGKSVAQLRFDQEGHPAVMTEWWTAETNDGFLVVAALFLILGAFFGGATVAGGEWRAGTVTTTLTWEPRRARLHIARSASAAILAVFISFFLQALFLASFLPSVFANGTTEGVNRSFWTGLLVAMSRISLMAAMAALLAVALATAARNTAFAVIAVFAWMVVIENLIRGLKPSLAPWLWAENVGTVMTWNQLPDVDFTRGPSLALSTLLFYCGAVIVGGAISFQRRDISAAS
jgi:ABC-type transport system involved in multi-copper enzyme maturation permease subunit